MAVSRILCFVPGELSRNFGGLTRVGIHGHHARPAPLAANRPVEAGTGCCTASALAKKRNLNARAVADFASSAKKQRSRRRQDRILSLFVKKSFFWSFVFLSHQCQHRKSFSFARSAKRIPFSVPCTFVKGEIGTKRERARKGKERERGRESNVTRKVLMSGRRKRKFEVGKS